jgi:trigger factor
LKVSTERQPESQVVLQIEVDDERLSKAKESAYKRLASKARIDGFRPGKAPRAVIETHLGTHAILHEALDRLLPEVYREALEQEEIDPVDRADYELVTEEPLVAKFTVPVRPTIDLGDYQATMRVEREPVAVEQERVDQAVEELRHRYATLEPADRPIEWGDVITADVKGEANGHSFIEQDDANFPLVEGRDVSLPGVAEAFLGHAKGDEFEIEVDIPEGPAKELGEGKAKYAVAIKEVKAEVLPELNDDFARQVGEGFETFAALRERLEDDLRKALEDEAEHAYHDKILDALGESATTFEFPSVFVEREIDRQVEDMGRQVAGGQASPKGDREALERFLQQLGKSEEELRADLRPAAEQRVRHALVLSHVAETEHILVEDPDVEAEIDRLASGSGSQSDEVRKLFSSENGKAGIRRSLVNRKTLERLAQIASGGGETVVEEAPDDTGTDD